MIVDYHPKYMSDQQLGGINLDQLRSTNALLNHMHMPVRAEAALGNNCIDSIDS